MWWVDPAEPQSCIDMSRVQALVAPKFPIAKVELKVRLPNRDISFSA